MLDYIETIELALQAFGIFLRACGCCHGLGVQGLTIPRCELDACSQ